MFIMIREKAVMEISEWVASIGDQTAAPMPHIYALSPWEEGRTEASTPAGAILVGDLNTEPSSRSIELLLNPSKDGTCPPPYATMD